MVSHSRHGAAEWARLLEFGQGVSLSSVGTCRNFLVVPRGSPIFKDEIVMVRADIQGSCDGTQQEDLSRRVLLKLRAPDWYVASCRQGVIKVLQSIVLEGENEYVLDATGIGSLVICAVPTIVGESISMAEIFSGGFAGWSQACYTLQQAGQPVHVAWSGCPYHVTIATAHVGSCG